MDIFTFICGVSAACITAHIIFGFLDFFIQMFIEGSKANEKKDV